MPVITEEQEKSRGRSRWWPLWSALGIIGIAAGLLAVTIVHPVATGWKNYILEAGSISQSAMWSNQHLRNGFHFDEGPGYAGAYVRLGDWACQVAYVQLYI